MNNAATTSRKLHIGGKTPAPGWEILNIMDAPGVDHPGNANDLSQFEAGSFESIYASHIAEHLDYIGELHATLKEWRRVLAPGGTLYISVPDLDILSEMMLDKDGISFDQRFNVMRMIFGGHVDEHDFHKVGLNEEFLTRFLTDSGFVDIERVEEFSLFEDTSAHRFAGRLISLNMIAKNPASVNFDGVRRNDPCPCNSGRKFKHCHGQIQ